jgi:RNA polymerase sigma factor (sigma-70 family)
VSAWGADARYTRLVEQHGMSLLRLAILLTGNRHDAEDAVQDALISVAGKWPAVQSVAYLRRAVSNAAIDLMRKRRDVLVAETPDVAIDDRGMFRVEDDERFFDRIRALPPGQRETIVLKYHADLDDRTIAKLQGVSVETVRSQAKRALKKLRVAARDEEVTA